MKKIYYTILCGLLITASSCKKFLDVNNTNPNAPVTATVDLVLPQALVQTAATSVTFNSYGAYVGGGQANAGGFGGFGSVLTYSYTTADNNGLWSQSYDNINDYQYVINNSTATGPYKNFNAIARIMKAFAYQRLVDVYGDLPYTQAAKGLANLTPKYDKAEDIYKDLFAQIDTAITSLNAANDPLKTIPTNKGVNGTIDVLNYSGTDGFTHTKWIQFANTIKLRLLIRIQNVSSLAATFNAQKTKLSAFTDADFIAADVMVQPGYTKQTGKQNPAYNAYAYDAVGNQAQTSTIPTWYADSFYDQATLYDPTRQGLLYQTTSGFNQLGYTGSDAANAPTGGNWYKGENGTGVLKGPVAAYPIMLLAEADFLKAEASLIGLVPSLNMSTEFKAGITASFDYLQRKADGTNTTDFDLAAEVDDYIAINGDPDNGLPRPYLVDLSLASNNAERLEAIITQKWIALNYLTHNESWAEYRRTGYPLSTSDGSEDFSFASLQSTSPRPDKLPVRVLYPATEYSLNAANAPANISAFTTRIFWDAN